MAAMAAAASIIAVAGGQSARLSVLDILFGPRGLRIRRSILQTFRIWRFGSGYSLGLISASAFIAICISALLAGGPALLSSLIVASSLIQFVFISRLSWLRRVISPLVTGTVLMLLASTIITVVLGRLSDLPEGAPPGGGAHPGRSDAVHPDDDEAVCVAQVAAMGVSRCALWQVAQ